MSETVSKLEELKAAQEALKLQLKEEEKALREKIRTEKEAEKKRIRDEELQAKEQLLRDAIMELVPYVHWKRHQMGDKPVVKYFIRNSMHNYSVTEFNSADRNGMNGEVARFFSTSMETAGKFLECETYFHYSKKPAELRGPDTAELILARVVQTTPELTQEPVALSNAATECCKAYVDLLAFNAGPTPCWDSLLSRIDRPDQFLAFVYSLFVAEDKGRQLCWLRDGGGGGKSTIIRAITKALGSSVVATVDTRKLEDKYFFGSVMGKRLMVDPDCQYLHLVGHTRVHNITGGDTVPVEKKFHDVIHEKVYAKIFVCSNYFPTIQREKNQESRLLMFDMKERKGEVAIDLDWEEGIAKEMPALLGKAALCYDQYADNHTIASKSTALDKCYSSEHSDYVMFLKLAGYGIGDGRISFQTVLRDAFFNYFTKNGRNVTASSAAFKFSQFERWMYASYNVSKLVNSNSVSYYAGVGKDEPIDPESVILDVTPIILTQGIKSDDELLG